MGLFKRAADKIAYEKESFRMGQDHLRKVKAESPDLYVKGYWKKTAAQRAAEVRQAKKR